MRGGWSGIIKKETYSPYRNDTCNPPLYYRDGGDYLFIHQELPESQNLLHRLRGVSRDIYLFGDQPKMIEEICTAFSNLSRESIKKIVRQLCGKRLMFQEADRILALAVRAA